MPGAKAGCGSSVLSSLFREYGWQFFMRVALPHPVKTARAFIGSGALDFSGDVAVSPPRVPAPSLEGARSIVGVGFCLKPIEPPCPSGRPNHDCHYLENLPHAGASDMPAACRQCAVRELGMMTLRTGAAFYIMTSAKEILLDVFAPALDEGRFSSGLFTLCRYSLRPFAVGLLASGMQGRMFTFATGDCRDYRTWLLADRGIKDERTEIDEPNRKKIKGLLRDAAKEPSPAARFERRGNVLYCRAADESALERAETAGSSGCAGDEAR